MEPNENKMSKKGEAKESGHPTSVSKIEKVGSSDGNGVRFPVHNHPDLSNVRGTKSTIGRE